MRRTNAKPDSAIQRSLVFLMALILSVAQAAPAADLNQNTIAAFDRYTKLTQTAFDTENKDVNHFLWIDRLPEDRRKQAYSQLHSGQIVIEPLETLDAGKAIAVPDGMIHHWIATIFIPGVTLEQTLAFEQDYNNEPKYFGPNVQSSRILSHNGPDFTVEIRFYEKHVVTVFLDTVHQIHYTELDSSHAVSRSWTTRIQQIDDAGTPKESLEPEGHDGGFLWRMNTYWRFEEKDGGIYIESQSVSLTRDIPTGLGWMIGPFITSIPRESLNFTLTATRNALLNKIRSGSGEHSQAKD